MLKTINDAEINRYFSLIVLTLVFFGILTAKFFQLQVAQHKKYREKANINSIRAERLNAPRGSIIDRDGKIIVDNAPTYVLSINRSQIEDIDESISYIGEILNIDTAILKKNYKTNYRGYFTPTRIIKDLTIEQILKFEEHKLELSGVEYAQIQERHYPQEIVGSHFLGYVKEIEREVIPSLNNSEEYRQGDIVGWQGLEKYYESLLKDKKGVEYKAVDAYGRIIGNYQNRESVYAVPGEDLIIGIDSELQHFIEELISGRRGCVIVGDPTIGEIISYVNSPSYPPDLFTGITSIEKWNKILNDPDKPLLDRNAKGLYPPGSIFKMIVLTYLSENNLISTNKQVFCSGEYQYGNRVFGCWDENGHGYVNFDKSLIESCDVYFYKVIQDIPLDEWSKITSEFGFGSKSGIDLPSESRGVVPTEEYLNKLYGKRRWTSGVKLNLAIGQGETLVTPIQLFNYINLFYTNGHTYTPHFALNSNPERIDIESISKSTWDRMNSLLYKVVTGKKGTGKLANPKIKGLKVAGKTGTAENPHGEPHAWFIGYAVKDGTARSYVVLLENAGHGGDESAPITREILRFIYGEKVKEIEDEVVRLDS